MISVCKLLQLLVVSATVAQAIPALKKREALPSYALTFAPVSHLYSNESWFPSDVAVHLANVIPEVNYTAVPGFSKPGSVKLSSLNNQSNAVYLTSKDPVEVQPEWLYSTYGRPDNSGYSGAPGTIIAVQKNDSWVDVFYFNFYSYHYGGDIVGINFYDHVGDWEHSMIRFINGEPYAIFLSQHGYGSAYYWEVLNKTSDERPLTFVAAGTHANYATAGNQDYTIALGLITDYTDDGTIWDITKNYRGYWYDNSTNTFSVAGGASTGGDEESGTEGASWLQWKGNWGDERYNSSDPDHGDQFCVLHLCKYISGPTGPVTQNLNRTEVCLREDDCTIFKDINGLTKQP